ncbi:C-terminal binding protein [Nesterenkonia ebinurensis]|uniref:C-terminal binding protein n=1 Tax=Nesterenkonia ebinurensis TaxID=2608252 RepID=UPI00123C8A3E|nr:C-terminal binding protein [Nesterenkonia ebinurensis]
MPRVVVTDYKFSSLHPERTAAASVKADFSAHQVTAESEAIEVTRGADVILVSQAPITSTVLEGLNGGATVIRYGIGVETVDLDAARNLGVRVCNIPDYGAETVADHTVTLVLSSLRRVSEFDNLIRSEGWILPGQTDPIRSLAEMTYGLIGIGQIGQLVAERIRPFGPRILAHDPFADPKTAAEIGTDLVEFPELLSAADVISLHAPLTPSTHHLLDYAALSSTKPGTIVVNTARGALVDTRAAAKLADSGHLGGLAFDVYEKEPLEPDHPLRTARRTILTPHAAFYSERSVRNLQRLAAEEMLRSLRGDPLRCELTA